jgi:hypothetical protein
MNSNIAQYSIFTEYSIAACSEKKFENAAFYNSDMLNIFYYTSSSVPIVDLGYSIYKGILDPKYNVNIFKG